MSAGEAKAIDLYLKSGRVPFFSQGYTEYKERLLLEICASPGLMAAFRDGKALPEDFGARLDERIVEYPWVFSRLPQAPAEGQSLDQSPDRGLIIDAGSTFNKKLLLESPMLAGRPLLIYTLETDWITYNPLVSYVFGDLRDMILKDGIADALVCISTLEHVGFTYDYTNYSRHKPWPHAKPESYLDAVREFWRVLKPRRRLLLTVPYGKYETHGWLQQFDAAMIEQVKVVFAGTTRAEVYYRYKNGGWQVDSPEACADLSYFNIHETGTFEEDGLAAARAVCCVDLEKLA